MASSPTAMALADIRPAPSISTRSPISMRASRPKVSSAVRPEALRTRTSRPKLTRPRPRMRSRHGPEKPGPKVWRGYRRRRYRLLRLTLVEALPGKGVEPLQACAHSPLKAACLPIPPPGRGRCDFTPISRFPWAERPIPAGAARRHEPVTGAVILPLYGEIQSPSRAEADVTLTRQE